MVRSALTGVVVTSQGWKMLSFSSQVWLTVAVCGAILFGGTHAEPITFPGGFIYDAISVDDAEYDPSILILDDIKDTGSYLFDATDILNKKLSLNYFVGEFLTTADSQYFRANPLLFQCLQKIQNEVGQYGHKLHITKGYEPLSPADLPADSSKTYHSTGSAVTVGFYSGGTIAAQDLVSMAAYICVPLFQIANRDIGLILSGDVLELRVQGSEEEGPLFTTADSPDTPTAEIEDQAWSAINDAYDPKKLPNCDPSVTLSSGQTYPSSPGNAEETVGKIHRPITRNDTEDFARLVQYPASLVAFENAERDSSWCGMPDRECVDCFERMKGFALNSRCADRTMSARLQSFLRTLGKLVDNEWNGVRLLVLEAWDEPDQDSLYEWGEWLEGSLHYEGRAALLVTSDEDQSKLDRLAGLATCASADYVEHRGDRIFVAAKKQLGFKPATVTFPRTELLAVEPPSAVASEYQLPEGFEGTEDQRPLFDKDHQMDVLLSDDVIVSQFSSEDGRYFRLNPHLLLCYQDLINHERKWNPTNPVDISVVHGFMTKAEHDSINYLDPRYGTPLLGQAVELTYSGPNVQPDVHHPERLMRQALAKCGPRFIKAGFSIGVGLYDDTVFVDMRKKFHAWVESSDLLGPDETEEDFKSEQGRWLLRAVENRIVDPVDPVLACQTSVRPAMQSVDFVHATPAVSSTDESSDDGNKCVPRQGTAFCQQSAPHRQTEVERIWTEVKKKHLYHNEAEVRAAVEGCFGACSTCKRGSLYEEKVRNCNNFFHWVPFELLEQQDQTNFYIRANKEMKVPACRTHCIDKTPLFSLLAPSVEALFRPDPDRSTQLRLYPEEGNPQPVYELLMRLYAIHASGVVSVWVKDVAELNILQEPLKVVMLYNKNVTQVKIYSEPLNQQSVAGRVAELIAEWTSQGCTDHSRTFLPPYGKVQDVPSGISKRSPKHNLRESMLERHANWERRWLLDHSLI